MWQITERTQLAGECVSWKGGASTLSRIRPLSWLIPFRLSNKEIAANLNLFEFTVKNHIYGLMKQVDAQNRHEAVTLIRDCD